MTSADVATVEQGRAAGIGLMPAWLWFGVAVYAVLLANGNLLLDNSDTYWHIAVGKWILDHGAMPHTDIYSFTEDGRALDFVVLACAGALCSGLRVRGMGGTDRARGLGGCDRRSRC